MGYGAFLGLVLLPKIPSIPGTHIPIFPVVYLPPLGVYMYFTLFSDVGRVLAEAMPWWELLTFSMYRVFMEVPWLLHVHDGNMPYCLDPPLFKAPSTYKLKICGKEYDFTV